MNKGTLDLLYRQTMSYLPTRRGAIQAGMIGTGLGLAELTAMQAIAAPQISPRAKQVLFVFLTGGISHHDTFDMKPDAPREYRGPYGSIPTSLPGLRISDKMPFHARIMDRTSVIRSFTHTNGDHWAAAHWLLTGYLGATGSDRKARNPSMGAISTHLLGSHEKGVPAYVNMNDGGFGFHGASYLGVACNPFRTGNFSYGNEAGMLPTARASSRKLIDGLTTQKISTRISLMRRLDALRGDIDRSGAFEGMDSMLQEAVDIVTSGRARAAFDVSLEDKQTRERYGPGWGEQALMARRLIEAGVRFVTLNTGDWDDHGNIKKALDNKLPRHDRALGVLSLIHI